MPKPARCYKCQAFGHTHLGCKIKGEYCPRCAGQHKFENCPQSDEIKCINCKGSHNAGYQGCKAYKEAEVVTRMANKMGISYATAVKRRAKENYEQAAAMARTSAAATAAAKKVEHVRTTTNSSTMTESWIKTKETASTTAGKRHREESENSQQQPTKINRTGAMQHESSIESSDDEGRLVIDENETPTSDTLHKPINKKALASAKDAEIEQLTKKQTK